MPVILKSDSIEGIDHGMVAYFARNTAPDGWLKANGAVVNRTTFASLFASIGTTYGAGNGSTTFALPDLRGEFPRGWDDGRGVDSGRGFGTAQGQGIPRLIGEIRDSHGSAAMSVANVSGFTNPFTPVGGNSSFRSSLDVVSTPSARLRFDSARVIPDSPVRPRNVALLACIKF